MSWYLVKIFNDKQYADNFIKGTLYLNRLSYFKNLENTKNDGRPDANEALSHWLQPEGLRIKWSVQNMGDIEITGKDLAAPISIAAEYHDHLHIFCMYAIYAMGFDLTSRKIDCFEHEIEELERRLKIDEKSFRLGDYAVVVAAPVFLDRLRQHLQARGDYFRGDLVKYYDDRIYNGEIPANDIPFFKQSCFSYQNEYRVCVHTKTMGDDPLNLEIGDISDICDLMKPSELNNLFTLQVRKPESP